MEPLPPSTESDSSTWQESNRKKRRRTKPEQDVNESALPFSGDIENRKDVAKKMRWRTDREMLVYSSKLIDALRRVRSRDDSASTSGGGGGGEIRETADRVLAVSANGTTRWSRAILASRFKATRRRSIVNKHIKKAKKRENISHRRLIIEKRRLPAVQKKVKTLSRLVPGCRKVSLTNLLEEASDYIAALQMQVKAMTALSEILTGTAPSDDRSAFPIIDCFFSP